MRKKILLSLMVAITLHGRAQKTPCTSDPVYREFDFWMGDWEVCGKNGKKGGDSKIQLILDSCVILENWTSANTMNDMHYAGKSFNTYNSVTRQWQQTWVDNVGGSTEFLDGHYENRKMIFLTKPFPVNKDTLAIRKLTSMTSIRTRCGSTVKSPGIMERRGQLNMTWSVGEKRISNCSIVNFAYDLQKCYQLV